MPSTLCNLAFDDDGQRVAAVDFELPEGEDAAEQDDGPLVAEAVAQAGRLLDLCLTPCNRKLTRRGLEAAQTRFIALVHLLRPGAVHGVTLRELAKVLGVSHAALGNHRAQIAKLAGMDRRRRGGRS